MIISLPNHDIYSRLPCQVLTEEIRHRPLDLSFPLLEIL